MLIIFQLQENGQEGKEERKERKVDVWGKHKEEMGERCKEGRRQTEGGKGSHRSIIHVDVVGRSCIFILKRMRQEPREVTRLNKVATAGNLSILACKQSKYTHKEKVQRTGMTGGLGGVTHTLCSGFQDKC